MPYQALYRKRQAEQDFLPRQWYLDDALGLSWVEGINIKRSSVLDKARCRGLIVEHPAGFMNGLLGNYTIIIASGLAPEMERFVVIKELMHCYFGPNGGHFATNSAVALDNHFRQFFGYSATIRSDHVLSEYKALWMAMGVLCPEHRRLEFKAEVEAQPDQPSRDAKIAEIAARLQAPVHTTKSLLSRQFEDEIAHIVK